ncbi:GGDEF domain-containing protein [Novosphingobium soli]|uniref:diguanylate cyclase n=1 Tax=Novosphingobium soli TaxID=574956 RepID=A0ABV6CYM7_9SPHN
MSALPAPDMTTIAACSTVLGAIMCIAVLLSWLEDGRPTQRRWLFAPFGVAVPAGVLLTWPELVPGPWGLRLGWFALTLVYGSAWLAARVMAGRTPRPLAMLAPCLAVLLFSCTVAAEGHWPELRMLPRTLLFAGFNGLAAREFARMRNPQLPSARTLRWIFAGFCAFELARAPLSLTLPAPFGPGEPQVWTIALFNFLLVLEGLLLGVFMTALGREQLAAQHYRLASIDPLTGIGNRRAFDARMARLASEGPNGSCTAVAVLDIDHFKAVNDELGHGFGDLVIVGAATVAQEVFGSANVFRIGGEEFAGIIVAGTQDLVAARAEMMREAFAARAHVQGEVSRRCTISIGVAVAVPGAEPHAIFAAADNALYLAKRQGRDRYVVVSGGKSAPGADVAAFAASEGSATALRAAVERRAARRR